MRLLFSIIAFFTLLVPSANACEPQPILKEGSCPSGYYSNGSYCVPSRGASLVVKRINGCPSGYYTSGNYCVASSTGSRLAIPKSGFCPSGWYTSGSACDQTDY